MAVKLPPWPTPDSLVRNTFLRLPVTVPPEAGGSARVEFGYAEYGADEKGESLFCSAERMERCAAPMVPGGKEPYLWASEQSYWMPCSNGCVISVPVLSGRILYYRVQRRVDGRVSSGRLAIKATD